MRFLTIGSGGREAAICQRLAKDKKHEVFCAPGNAGISRQATCLPNLKPTDLDGIVRYAVQNAIDVVVVGPEVPLIAGLANRLDGAGILCCGPNARAARAEGSKAWFKKFLTRHNLPTAAYGIFYTRADAYYHIYNRGAQTIVIKADGPCGGKGVELPETEKEAHKVLTEFMVEGKFGEAGKTVVIEDRLVGGFEVSAMGITDGTTVYCFPFAQDHKRRYEDHQEYGLKKTHRSENPNTGGMGAYTMTLSPVLHGEIRRLMQRVIDAFRAERIEYHGFIYLGLMVTKDGIFILELNCRLGDPETQVILPVIDGDFGILCYAAASGNLSSVKAPEQIAQALGVVLVSGEYPGKSTLDIPIPALKDPLDEGVFFFDAGMKLSEYDGVATTNGCGRIGTVVAVAEDLRVAHARAYTTIEEIIPKVEEHLDNPDFEAYNEDNLAYRTDIGWQALGTEAYDAIDEVLEEIEG